MGFFTRIAQAFGLMRLNASVLVVGLDNSGKTTLIHHLKPGSRGGAGAGAAEITPTVGFEVDEFSKSNINFRVFDMSGKDRFRSLWEGYYREVDAVIFVLDSTDRVRMCVAKEELDILLSHADMKDKDIPLLFFANKMDLPGAMGPEAICEGLGLDDVRHKAWHIATSVATTGEGVENGVNWLCERITTSSGRRK